LIFHLQSSKGAETPTRQRFLDGRVQVISRSGLNLCEAHLLETLPDLLPIKSADPKVLTIGNRSGVLGQVACDVLGAEATAHTFDIHHYRGMEPHVVAAFRQRFRRVCQSDLPLDETYDVVLLQLNRGNLPTELVHDFIQQAIQKLRPGGRIVCAIQGTSLWLMRRLQDSFRNVQTSKKSSDLSVLVATDCKGVGKSKSFASQLEVTLPHGISFPLVTYPGVFAHRKVDAGGLALAESMDVTAGDRVLDLGCGSGLIGIAAGKMAQLDRLVLVDSHARAIRASNENVQANGLADRTQVIHSDGRASDFVELQNQFTLFVGNPPYYSQNQVTSRFVELSFQVLQSGGRAWFVTKNPEWLGKEIEQTFGEVQYFTRRDYTLLRSVKP
jgi:16S rRNA G1207 methylase RsmC